MTRADLVDRTVEKTHIWLNEIAAELGSDDQAAAYRVLRAYLRALRDRLPVGESAQLAAQLPDLIRGIYYEGWVPARTPIKYRTTEEFLGRIARDAQLKGETEASYACAAVSRVLRRHVTEGELADVEALLPKKLRPVVAG
jgi:uncharacterized protein (DUF2267 family)